MELKEAMKWIGILVVAGLISTALELLIEWRIKGTVTATAQAEVRREMAKLAAARATSSKAGVAVSPKRETSIVVLPQSENNGYGYTL